MNTLERLEHIFLGFKSKNEHKKRPLRSYVNIIYSSLFFIREFQQQKLFCEKSRLYSNLKLISSIDFLFTKIIGNIV